jgi:hypothetical protein
MFTNKIPTGLIRCLLVGLMLLMVAGELRAADEALPSSVKSYVKRISGMLDQADKSLQADRLTSAQRKIKEANKTLAELQKRYAGKFSEDHPDYKAMTDRLAAITERVEAAANSEADAAGQAAEAEAKNEALCNTWVEKLGPFVDYDSDLYLRIGSNLNSASEEDQAKSHAAYPKAKVLMAEYKQVTFPLGKTMDLQNVESSLTSAMSYYGEEEEAANQEEACAPWVAKLSPFVNAAPSNDKLLIASATVDAQQIKTQQAIYEEAKAVFAEYQQAEFPLGKSWRMEQVEEELADELEAFPQALADSMAMMSGDIGKRLDGVLAYLNRDTSWQNDTRKKPPIVMQRDLKPLREEVERVAGTGAADAAELAELKGKLETIEQLDAQHRKVRSERTYQSPDGFTGSDIGTLKAKAEEVAKAEYKDVRVLRTTVPSQEWAVEDVIEATDTTNTALRHRITRSVRAQLALRHSDGTVHLQEVYLGQDKQPDGWGALKGHTTWSDWMQEANVGKNAPK